jgi:rhamnogalacturonan endolyase
MNTTRLFRAATLPVLVLLGLALATHAAPLRQMENLGRGVVALRSATNTVFVSWRILGTDPAALAFNLYRAPGDAPAQKLNAQPIHPVSNWVDQNAPTNVPLTYFVRPLLAGQEGPASQPFTVRPGAVPIPYLSIPLQTPPGYTPNDASVGDLDGDGEYEIVLHQTGRGRDNSQAGPTDPPIFEAYKLDGTRLWLIHLGRNIREGAHYTQFMVYDFDGDGRAEVAMKTADGTLDGTGRVIGNRDADHRGPRGNVLAGPEFLTVFEGRTGRALATTGYLPPRGEVDAWGDTTGNRVDRFLACVAYLDGERPSLVMCRGYYTRTVLAAWNWRGGQLTNVWTFDTETGPEANRVYRGQGNHNLSVGDVDGDGRDEILYGACAIDDNGQGLYTTGLGHGDAMHLADHDPIRPGLEVFAIHEKPRHPHGAELHDAATGKILWSKPSPDVGRGIAIDIDPRHPGSEMWAAGEGLRGLWNARGEVISDARPRSCNAGIWWDGDELRELLDGSTIDKWDWVQGRATRLFNGGDHNCVRNNGTKANPCLSADLLGDWREELILRTADNRELRIFSTTLPTQRRLHTLMHDPIYRLGVAWQNVSYNQPPHTGFHLGADMADPPMPAIRPVPANRP